MRRSKFRRALSIACALFVGAVLLSACSPNAPAPSPVPAETTSGLLADVLNAGVLVIAVDPAAPPHSERLNDQARSAETRCDATQYSANQFAGFDIEVAKEIARRLGVEPCFVTPAWSQIIAGGWGGLWDVTIQSMVITPERMEKLYFTQPYISGEMFAFVHQDNQAVRQPADLSGKKIGVCAGCANEQYLLGALKIPGERIEYQIKEPQIVGYDTDTSALADLAAGDGLRLDAVISDPDTGAVAIAQGLPVRRLDAVLYRDFSAAAVDRAAAGDPLPLVDRLSQVIQQMHQDGTLARLSRQFYNGDFTAAAAQFDLSALH